LTAMNTTQRFDSDEEKTTDTIMPESDAQPTPQVRPGPVSLLATTVVQKRAKNHAKRLRKRDAAVRKLNKIGRREGFKVEGENVNFQRDAAIGHELLKALASATCPVNKPADEREIFEDMWCADFEAFVGAKS